MIIVYAVIVTLLQWMILVTVPIISGLSTATTTTTTTCSNRLSYRKATVDDLPAIAQLLINGFETKNDENSLQNNNNMNKNQNSNIDENNMFVETRTMKDDIQFMLQQRMMEMKVLPSCLGSRNDHYFRDGKRQRIGSFITDNKDCGVCGIGYYAISDTFDTKRVEWNQSDENEDCGKTQSTLCC